MVNVGAAKKNITNTGFCSCFKNTYKLWTITWCLTKLNPSFFHVHLHPPKIPFVFYLCFFWFAFSSTLVTYCSNNLSRCLWPTPYICFVFNEEHIYLFMDNLITYYSNFKACHTINCCSFITHLLWFHITTIWFIEWNNL